MYTTVTACLCDVASTNVLLRITTPFDVIVAVGKYPNLCSVIYQRQRTEKIEMETSEYVIPLIILTVVIVAVVYSAIRRNRGYRQVRELEDMIQEEEGAIAAIMLLTIMAAMLDNGNPARPRRKRRR